MNLYLKKAKFSDCSEIHKMQIESFKTLLEKYKDYATSPASEPLEAVQNRFNQPFADYYFG